MQLTKSSLFYHAVDRFRPYFDMHPNTLIWYLLFTETTQKIIKNQGTKLARGYFMIIIAIENTKTKLKSHY
jgi:hypothetical protein